MSLSVCAFSFAVFCLKDSQGVAYRAQVGGVLHLQDKGHRAMNDGLYEVCEYRLAIGAFDAG